jgi:hypothetical protein
MPVMHMTMSVVWGCWWRDVLTAGNIAGPQGFTEHQSGLMLACHVKSGSSTRHVMSILYGCATSTVWPTRCCWWWVSSAVRQLPAPVCLLRGLAASGAGVPRLMLV